MNPRLSFICASLALLAAMPAHAAFLLSDNVVRADGVSVYPRGVSVDNRIATGATYTYLTESGNTGLGNTDAQIVTNDASFAKLMDGYNERAGGSSAVYGTWQGQSGATILFDLKDTFVIDHVSVSVRDINATGAGVATYQVYVSTDGINYTALGTWGGDKNILDSAQSEPGRNTELSISAAALTEARYVKIYLSHWNADHTSRLFNQLAIGEVAIWGAHTSSVPEPAASAVIFGSLILVLAIGRKRSRRS